MLEVFLFIKMNHETKPLGQVYVIKPIIVAYQKGTVQKNLIWNGCRFPSVNSFYVF